MDKQALLAKIQHEFALWESFLREVGEERMEQPGAAGEWSFKDVVAHLSGWRRRTLERLEAVQQGKEPPAPFWPAELGDEGDDEESDQRVERINHWIYQQNRNRPLQDVLNESRQQFRDMEAIVKTIPEEALFDPNRFAWMGGRPAARLVDFGHFHEEHEPSLRAWLRSLP